ncbi:hypothetical protein B0H15DRAFT_856820 [Mycena belliarum]|uniref:Uncharacterized protein n=1 Tax=Mycena belliarum TaxID=1033014 RepID=A0AAD6XK35_9AGAR|nr:hypothetical protein B0H15DRAFT_856820 [Mycena belliae]
MELVLVFSVIVWFLFVVVRPFRSLPSAPTPVAPRRQGAPSPQALFTILGPLTPARPYALYALFEDAHFLLRYTHPRRRGIVRSHPRPLLHLAISPVSTWCTAV